MAVLRRDARPGQVTIGTIIKAAKDAGFVFMPSTQPVSTGPSTIDSEQVNGRGGDVKSGSLFASMFRQMLLHIHETGEWLQFSPEQGWVSAPPGKADAPPRKRSLRCASWPPSVIKLRLTMAG